MMNVKLIIVILSILMVTVLAAGCAQAAVVPAPQKPAAAATDTGASQTAATPVQSSDAAKTTDNTTSVPANPPAAGNAEITKVGDILQNPQTYGGKVVKVSGKIVNECGSGCWFTLQDGNAVIYIDLAPNNMVIPQKKGSAAKVTGEIVREGTDVYMVGSKVDF
jgi:hypothetical protein